MAVGCEEPLPRVRLFLLLLLLSLRYTSARERKRRAVRDPYARSTDTLTYKVSLVHNTDDDESALVDPPNVRSVTLK